MSGVQNRFESSRPDYSLGLAMHPFVTKMGGVLGTLAKETQKERLIDLSVSANTTLL